MPTAWPAKWCSGSATDNHRGPVNLSQFGKGQWQAQRAA